MKQENNLNYFFKTKFKINLMGKIYTNFYYIKNICIIS
jgi:hypothetical protein